MAGFAITDNLSGKSVSVGLRALTKTLAAREIDAKWWQKVGYCGIWQDEEWSWAKIVVEESGDFCEVVGLATEDNEIEGAIAFRYNGLSILESDAGAVFVEYLASAPWNRGTDEQPPRFLGVGLKLLQYAVSQSLGYGLKGRIMLASLNDPKTMAWYEKRNLKRTGKVVVDNGQRLPLFELPAGKAAELLRAEK